MFSADCTRALMPAWRMASDSAMAFITVASMPM
jgi:hypothetical protein